MKKFSIFLFFLFMAGCTQEPADVMYNDRKVYSRNNYVNYNYNKGTYRTAPDGRVVRDISMKEESNIPKLINNNYNLNDNYNNEQNNSNKNIVNNDVNNKYEYVIVKPEDSLYRIAKNNNVNLEELVKLNNIDSSYNIVVGQKIIIPRKDTSYASSNMSNTNTIDNSIDNTFKVPDINKIRQNNGNYHIVNKGETLYSISKAYNVDMDEIIKSNNLIRPYNLSLGQRLLISKNEVKKPENNTIQVVKKTTKIAGKEVERINTNDNDVKKLTSISSNEFIWPIKGELLRRFGDKINDTYHDGINIKSTKGTAIKASKSGEVAYSGNELKGYGNIIILRHANNWLTIYAHCDELKVRQGDSVKQGDIIATIGSTGNVDDNQLYFSIREGRETKDPLKFLK